MHPWMGELLFKLILPEQQSGGQDEFSDYATFKILPLHLFVG